MLISIQFLFNEAQALLQYFTEDQLSAHFFLHEKGRWQTGQIFSGFLI
jgi:hypothetical protein